MSTATSTLHQPQQQQRGQMRVVHPSPDFEAPPPATSATASRLDAFQVLEMIGEGSFGTVYKGRRRYTADIVALKFIARTGRTEKEVKALQREVDIMAQLVHPNIVRMLETFEAAGQVVVVTEYVEGELFQILEDDRKFALPQVRSVAAQLVSALRYLHAHRIMHRDLKPQNVLVDACGLVKVCDFGFARAMGVNTMVLTSIKGTPLYMAPEILRELPYDHTADLWSLGCILYEMYTGLPPFYTHNLYQLVNQIVKDPIAWPDNFDPGLKGFLRRLLHKDPRKRTAWPDLAFDDFLVEGKSVPPTPTTMSTPASTQADVTIVDSAVIDNGTAVRKSKSTISASASASAAAAAAVTTKTTKTKTKTKTKTTKTTAAAAAAAGATNPLAGAETAQQATSGAKENVNGRGKATISSLATQTFGHGSTNAAFPSSVTTYPMATGDSSNISGITSAATTATAAADVAAAEEANLAAATAATAASMDKSFASTAMTTPTQASSSSVSHRRKRSQQQQQESTSSPRRPHTQPQRQKQPLPSQIPKPASAGGAGSSPRRRRRQWGAATATKPLATEGVEISAPLSGTNASSSSSTILHAPHARRGANPTNTASPAPIAGSGSVEVSTTSTMPTPTSPVAFAAVTSSPIESGLDSGVRGDTVQSSNSKRRIQVLGAQKQRGASVAGTSAAESLSDYPAATVSDGGASSTASSLQSVTLRQSGGRLSEDRERLRRSQQRRWHQLAKETDPRAETSNQLVSRLRESRDLATALGHSLAYAVDFGGGATSGSRGDNSVVVLSNKDADTTNPTTTIRQAWGETTQASGSVSTSTDPSSDDWTTSVIRLAGNLLQGDAARDTPNTFLDGPGLSQSLCKLLRGILAQYPANTAFNGEHMEVIGALVSALTSCLGNPTFVVAFEPPPGATEDEEDTLITCAPKVATGIASCLADCGGALFSAVTAAAASTGGDSGSSGGGGYNALEVSLMTLLEALFSRLALEPEAFGGALRALAASSLLPTIVLHLPRLLTDADVGEPTVRALSCLVHMAGLGPGKRRHFPHEKSRHVTGGSSSDSNNDGSGGGGSGGAVGGNVTDSDSAIDDDWPFDALSAMRSAIGEALAASAPATGHLFRQLRKEDNLAALRLLLQALRGSRSLRVAVRLAGDRVSALNALLFEDESAMLEHALHAATALLQDGDSGADLIGCIAAQLFDTQNLVRLVRTCSVATGALAARLLARCAAADAVVARAVVDTPNLAADIAALLEPSPADVAVVCDAEGACCGYPTHGWADGPVALLALLLEGDGYGATPEAPAVEQATDVVMPTTEESSLRAALLAPDGPRLWPRMWNLLCTDSARNSSSSTTTAAARVAGTSSAASTPRSALSPAGLVDMLRALYSLLRREPKLLGAAHTGVPVQRAVSTLVTLLSPQHHLLALEAWPAAAGGGVDALEAVVAATAKLLHAPLALPDIDTGRAGATAAPTRSQALAAMAEHKAVSLLLATCATSTERFAASIAAASGGAVATKSTAAAAAAMARKRLPAAVTLPAGLAMRLIVTGAPGAAADFVAGVDALECGGHVQLDGSAAAFATNVTAAQQLALYLLDERRAGPALVADTLAALSRLARTSALYDDTLEALGVVPAAAGLINSNDAHLRAKACNAFGNLFRHSDRFYERFGRVPSACTHLIARLADPDAEVVKFAAFALGNLVFHNDAFYARIAPAVPQLVRILSMASASPTSTPNAALSPRTLGNAAGALGNLARNSGALGDILAQAGAAKALLDLAVGIARQQHEKLIQPKQAAQALHVSLFAAGTLAKLPACRAQLLEANATAAIASLGALDRQGRQFARRLKTKLGLS
eukprot:UC1_evm4s1688